MAKSDPSSESEGEEESAPETKVQPKSAEKGNDKDGNEEVSSSSDEDDDDDDDDDDLGLEGVLVRNSDASSSSSSDNDDDNDNDEEEEDQEDEQKPRSKDKKRSSSNESGSKKSKPAKKKQRKSKSPKVDMIQVDFTFHDMDEKFFHGIKALLHNSSTVYQQFSSELSDSMIDNISVGTLISTEGDTDHNVYGFASVLNVKTYQSSPAIQHLNQICLKHCPSQHLDELQVVLSGTTKRPAGFLLHGRMINLPLEVTLALHQQLVLDMDWAVEHAEGGIDERKSLDFGAFVRIAPCQIEGGSSHNNKRSTTSAGGKSSLVYRFFDDEIFAERAEFSFTVDAPKSYSKEEPQKLQIMVLTKTGHRLAMKDMEQMVGGGSS